MASDEELMQGASRGDMAAFGELVRRHQRLAWNMAWRMMGDAAEAEDAAQEAFLKILDAAPRYRPLASFRTYLCRVVTRLCLDRMEKKRPHYVERPRESSSPELGPPERLMQQESAEAVRRALDALPPRQRAALVLRHFEDMSYLQIADAMRVSEKSVERLLARGRHALQRRLSDAGR